MGTGQEFAKKLGVGGAIFVLILGIICTALMFTAKGSVVDGYVKPQTDEYYAGHIEELRDEIEDDLLPRAGIAGVTVELSGGVIAVSGPKAQLHEARLAIIHYYDEELFEFTEATP